MIFRSSVRIDPLHKMHKSTLKEVHFAYESEAVTKVRDMERNGFFHNLRNNLTYYRSETITSTLRPALKKRLSSTLCWQVSEDAVVQENCQNWGLIF